MKLALIGPSAYTPHTTIGFGLQKNLNRASRFVCISEGSRKKEYGHGRILAGLKNKALRERL
jgi:hypothetical protein